MGFQKRFSKNMSRNKHSSSFTNNQHEVYKPTKIAPAAAGGGTGASCEGDLSVDGLRL